MRKERFGELNAYVVGAPLPGAAAPALVVVLMHGYGAAGNDLVDLARILPVSTDVCFVFPEAPLPLDDGMGRAWWELDLSLFERRARGERVDRSEELPEALPEVRRRVAVLLREVERRLSVDRSRLLIGGFSQGSMVACDVVLHEQEKPAGLMLLSSTLIARPLWQAATERCRGLPVLQSHGRRDPLLAYDDALRLSELLQAGGAELTFVEFPGGHDIPPVVLAAMTRFIDRLATRAPRA